MFRYMCSNDFVASCYSTSDCIKSEFDGGMEMRYMIQWRSDYFECFDSEEYKDFLESIGIFVIDLENWAV